MTINFTILSLGCGGSSTAAPPQHSLVAASQGQISHLELLRRKLRLQQTLPHLPQLGPEGNHVTEPYVPSKLVRQVLYAQILPLYDYGCAVWSPVRRGQLDSKWIGNFKRVLGLRPGASSTSGFRFRPA